MLKDKANSNPLAPAIFVLQISVQLLLLNLDTIKDSLNHQVRLYHAQLRKTNVGAKSFGFICVILHILELQFCLTKILEIETFSLKLDPTQR